MTEIIKNAVWYLLLSSLGVPLRAIQTLLIVACIGGFLWVWKSNALGAGLGTIMGVLLLIKIVPSLLRLRDKINNSTKASMHPASPEVRNICPTISIRLFEWTLLFTIYIYMLVLAVVSVHFLLEVSQNYWMKPLVNLVVAYKDIYLFDGEALDKAVKAIILIVYIWSLISIKILIKEIRTLKPNSLRRK